MPPRPPVAPAAAPAEAGPRDWSTDMARAQGGDREAYRCLLQDIAPYLRALARRRFDNPAEIDDAVQDVLLALHTVRHTYDPARPFVPWLLVIAQRRFIDRLRRRGRSTAREVPLDPERETIEPSQANILIEEWSGRALREAIDGLPPAQREAMRLLKLEELSLKEAALASGMSIAALKVASHRAIKRLRALLRREDYLA